MWFWKRESCGDNERTWLLEIQAEGEINKQHRGLLGHETAWISWRNYDGLLWVSTRWIWNVLRFEPLGRCVCERVPRKNWQREGDAPVECLIDTSWKVAGGTYISRRSRKRQLGLLVDPTLPLSWLSTTLPVSAPPTSESNFCLPRCTEDQKLSRHPPVPDWGSWGIWLPELCSYWIPRFSSVQVAIVGLPSIYSISELQ